MLTIRRTSFQYREPLEMLTLIHPHSFYYQEGKNHLYDSVEFLRNVGLEIINDGVETDVENWIEIDKVKIAINLLWWCVENGKLSSFHWWQYHSEETATMVEKVEIEWIQWGHWFARFIIRVHRLNSKYAVVIIGHCSTYNVFSSVCISAAHEIDNKMKFMVFNFC